MSGSLRILLLLLFSLTGAGALGQSSVTDGVLINADSMYRDLEKRVVKLSGNVQVVFQGQHLSCDRATLDLRKQSIAAEGHVILNNEKVHIEGDKVVFNYKQDTGFIYKGFVQSGQVVFEGDVIEKISKDRYLASNAEYTACETCPPGWSFSGRSIDAELGGYARIKRPVFKVGGIPILILPSIIVPLKSSRQSGFLVPSMHFSKRGGFELAESYFWALDRSQDLTLTSRWYDLRGLKTQADYRYVLSESSRGRMQGAWMEDRALLREYKSMPSGFDRWFVWYEHRHDMPEGYVSRAEIKGVSDIRYPRDFIKELPGHGDPALQNKASITKSRDNDYFSGEITYYTNLLHTYPAIRNEDAVHRFPEIRYSVKETRLGEIGPFMGLDVDYVNFARAKHNYDDLKFTSDNTALEPLGVGPQGEIERDGRYDPATDRFRTGQRLDVRPTVTYPFQIARKFDVLPAVSFRETQYWFHPTDNAEADGFSSTAARRYVQTDVRTRTEFTRVFGNTSDPKSSRWKHSIEPELGYSHIPWIRNPNHPFFGNFVGQQYSRQYQPLSDSDIVNNNSKLQFDYEDRTYERQVVDFALINRLSRKSWLNGSPDYQTAALFKLWQSYDFNEARAARPNPWSSVNALLDMRFEHFETFTTASYNGYAKVTDTSARVRYKHTPSNFFQVGFTRNFILTDELTVAPNGETRNAAVGAGLLLKYFEAVGEVQFNARNWNVQGWNYVLNIRPPGRCWLIKIEHHQPVGGQSEIGGSLNFDFGGV